MKSCYYCDKLFILVVSQQDMVLVLTLIQNDYNVLIHYIIN